MNYIKEENKEKTQIHIMLPSCYYIHDSVNHNSVVLNSHTKLRVSFKRLEPGYTLELYRDFESRSGRVDVKLL